MNFKIPFSGTGAEYSELEKATVLKAMCNKETLTQGKYQEAFEKKFSEYISKKYCFATSTAANALELCATVLSLSKDDEIVCPAHTYNASAYPFAKHGGKLVWADINPDTLVVDVETLDRVVKEKTKAIVVVHLYGAPANMPLIMDYARKRNIIVIEDCAQSIGAEIDGQLVGSFGDFSIFSFHSHKNISTLGEGGMLCMDSPDFSRLIRGLRHNGHSQFVREDPSRYWLPAMSNVDVDIENIWPNNFCLGEVQCALGAVMLDRVEQINNKRRMNYEYFEMMVEDIDQIKLQTIYPKGKSSHHLLPLKFKGLKINRDFVIEKLAYEYGVQAIVQYYPLNRYPLFYKNGYGEAFVPNTDEFFDNMISLPFHSWIKQHELEYMTESLISIIKEYD